MAEIAIDQSRLPKVQEVCRGFALLEDGALAYSLQEQEIEQHYASNIQKSQLVRQDVRVAKILQDQEQRHAHSHSLEEQNREQQDSQLAMAVQQEIHSRATEQLHREEQDKAIALQLQEEELEMGRQGAEEQEDPPPLTREEVHSELGVGAGVRSWSLDRGVARLGIRDAQRQPEVTESLRGDEELARHLQQEEETRLADLRSQSQRSREEDFRVAQVAQDEEIARFIQRQELKAQKQAEEEAEAGDRRSCHRHRAREGKSNGAGGRGERLSSEGSASGEWSPPREHRSTEPTQKARQLFPRNIAEALDPTFKTQNTDLSLPEPHSPLTPELCGSCPVPPGGLYDYMDDNSEPEFGAPTHRHQENVPRQKPKDKKESCKQQ